MAISDFKFNPFALTTAESAWQNQEDSAIKKGCKIASGAVYDIFVKNPYDLTIGNSKTLSNLQATPSRATRISVIATVVLGALYTCMLYGTSLHLQGRCLISVGSRSGLASLVKVGEVVKKVGTQLFLTGAVPVYGTFYALPKYIMHSLPKVIQVLAAKISIVAKWVFENVLYPLWNRVIVPVVKGIADLVSFVAEKVFIHVLKPLWNQVLYPVLKAVATKLASTMEALGRIVVKVCEWILSEIIAPLWNHILLPAFHAIGRFTVYVGEGVSHMVFKCVVKIGQCAQWILQNVIGPLWDHLFFPVFKLVGRAFATVARIVGESLEVLAQATLKAASFIFQKVIVPFFTVVYTVGKLLGNYVVKPLINVIGMVAEKVALMFKAIYDYLLVPTAESLAALMRAIRDSIPSFL